MNGSPVLFSGYIHVYYNSIAANGAIQFFRGCSQNVDPATDIRLVGNIGYLSPGCNPGYGTWHVDHNLWTNTRFQANRPGWPPCGSGDRLGSATFVNDSMTAPDLHLQRGSAGLGVGDPLSHPPDDIDGRPRPLRWPPDAGAAEDDLARARLGRSIGMVGIGFAEANVRKVYGAPARILRRRIGVARENVRIAVYREHGGALQVSYDSTDTVVGLSTTSLYYSTAGGLGVGADATGIRNGRIWNTCLHGWTTGINSRVITYFGAPTPTAKKIGSMVMLDRRLAPKCARAHHRSHG